MARARKPAPLYVGIRHSVVALDRETGAELWRTKLKSGLGSTFACVFVERDALYATAAGEVWRLDPATGAVLWNAPLKGLGQGFAVLASPTIAADAQQAAYVATAQTIAAAQAASAAAASSGG